MKLHEFSETTSSNSLILTLMILTLCSTSFGSEVIIPVPFLELIDLVGIKAMVFRGNASASGSNFTDIANNTTASDSAAAAYPMFVFKFPLFVRIKESRHKQQVRRAPAMARQDNVGATVVAATRWNNQATRFQRTVASRFHRQINL